jgi:DNA-binding transcriptional MerR regulator
MRDIKDIPRTYMEVPLSEIEIDMSQNPRPGFKDLDNFSKIIGLQGIQIPVALRKNENGKFEILDGFRRCYAAKVNNFEKVPAVIYDCSKAEGKMVAAALNYYRKTQGAIAIGSHVYESIMTKLEEDGYSPEDTETIEKIIDSYYLWAAKTMGVSVDEIAKLLRAYMQHAGKIPILKTFRALPDKYLPQITNAVLAVQVANKFAFEPKEVAKIFAELKISSAVAQRILEDPDFLSQDAKRDISKFKKELQKKRADIRKFTENLRTEIIDMIERYAQANAKPRSLATEELIELGYDTWERE